MRLCLTILLVGLASRAIAAEAKGLGDPGKLEALAFDNGSLKDHAIELSGRDASRQLIVTGRYSSKQLRDLTRSAKYTSEPAGIVQVDPTGYMIPLKEGTVIVTATHEEMKTSVTVNVSRLTHDKPVHFANQVVPIFTKFGCNAGGCHGKADGQNGFKLSLLGFEPGDDYEYLVKEARGRRVFASSPENSLLLRKATGAMPHGGGKKLDANSPFYQVMLRWIEQGAPWSQAKGSEVTRIEALPRTRLLDLKGQQQIAVLAHHADGSVSDVTRMTQFESNHPDVAEVSQSGHINAKGEPGMAAIMARYQSHVDVFQATIPLGAPIANMPASENFIDKLIFEQLGRLGLPPSGICDDATFLRRVTIDIAGRLPTKDETTAFLGDETKDKRANLVGRLLDSKDYADYFANKWSAVLRNRRKAANESMEPTTAFHKWIRDSIAENKPYDQFVRAIVTATGEEVKTPPVVWFRELKAADAIAEDTAQLFLGQRIACAKCHHHPLEKWAQHDYWGFVGFFATAEVKDPKPAKKGKTPEPAKPASVAMKSGKAEMKNPRTGKPVPATGLGAEACSLPADADPRDKLADWMCDPKNPFFARSLVNRYWKHFLGRGLVEPEDDMRATNPPTNPELLDALANRFIESKYNLKELIRAICTSKTYQLSAEPNAHNAGDRQNYSRFYPRRLNAEVLLDAIDELTGLKTKFKGVPDGTRAVQLPDNLFESYFLSVFGRPEASSACECERSGGATLAQALHMFNSDEVMKKLAGPRAQALAKDKRPHEERLDELFLVAFSRKARKDENKLALDYIARKGDKVQEAYEDLMWAMINTKEFMFNH